MTNISPHMKRKHSLLKKKKKDKISDPMKTQAQQS